VNFFKAIGGSFKNDELIFPTNEGLKEWRNGDLCNGQPGKWYMFVNGTLNDDFQSHIPAPYSQIPPGDEIKLVFTENSLAQINPILGEAP